MEFQVCQSTKPGSSTRSRACPVLEVAIGKPKVTHEQAHGLLPFLLDQQVARVVFSQTPECMVFIPQ
jgi:hypothetical protein